MADRIIRVRLREEIFRKFKVYCAINDLSLTNQVTQIINTFVDKQQENIKIINIANKKD